MSTRDIAITSTLCLVGLGFAIASGVTWQIVVSSVCVVVALAIVVVDYSGLGDRWAERIRRAYLDYRLGDRR